MPVIKFTEADKMMGKTMEKGAYRALLTEITPPTPSKSQKSVSYFATFRISAGPYLNKELKIAFNTETNSASLLGTLQYNPARDLMKVVAAIKGTKYEDVELEVDTDVILNKPLGLLIDVETVEGNVENKITAFIPDGLVDNFKAPF